MCIAGGVECARGGRKRKLDTWKRDRLTQQLLILWFGLCSLLVFSKAELLIVFYIFVACFVVEYLARSLAYNLLRDWQAWYLTALYKNLHVPLDLLGLPLALHGMATAASALLRMGPSPSIQNGCDSAGHIYSDSHERYRSTRTSEAEATSTASTSAGSGGSGKTSPQNDKSIRSLAEVSGVVVLWASFLGLRLPVHTLLVWEAARAVNCAFPAQLPAVLFPELAAPPPFASPYHNGVGWGSGLGCDQTSAACALFFAVLFSLGSLWTLLVMFRSAAEGVKAGGAGVRMGGGEVQEAKTAQDAGGACACGMASAAIPEPSADLPAMGTEKESHHKNEGGVTVAASTPPHLWRVHGTLYDLAPFVDRHPGGKAAINLGRGRDCTAMFESYHPFTNRHRSVLAKHAVPNGGGVGGKAGVGTVTGAGAGATYAGVPSRAEADPFYDLLCKRVEALLNQAGRDPRHHPSSVKATPQRLVYYMLVILAVAVTYVGYARGHPGGPFLFAVSAWLLGALGHDGGHFAVAGAAAPWADSLATLGMGLIASPFMWMHQHTYAHHSFTNDLERDPDLHHYTDVLRTHPLQGAAPTLGLGAIPGPGAMEGRKGTYKMQVYRAYVYACYTMTVLGEALYIPVVLMRTGNLHGVVPIPRLPRGAQSQPLWGPELAQLAHLALFGALVVVAPLCYGGGAVSVVLYLVTSGLLFGIFSQINHLNGESIGAAASPKGADIGVGSGLGSGAARRMSRIKAKGITRSRTEGVEVRPLPIPGSDGESSTVSSTAGAGECLTRVRGREKADGSESGLATATAGEWTGVGLEGQGTVRVAGSWAAEQVETSNNFCPGSRLWGLLSNGLNYQIEHHLFPGVNHEHLPLLAPAVRRVCEENGVRYKSFSSMRAILAETAAFYRDLAD